MSEAGLGDGGTWPYPGGGAVRSARLACPGCSKSAGSVYCGGLVPRLGIGPGSPESGPSSAAKGGVGWCMGGFFCALCASDVFGA